MSHLPSKTCWLPLSAVRVSAHTRGGTPNPRRPERRADSLPTPQMLMSFRRFYFEMHRIYKHLVGQSNRLLGSTCLRPSVFPFFFFLLAIRSKDAPTRRGGHSTDVAVDIFFSGASLWHTGSTLLPSRLRNSRTIFPKCPEFKSGGVAVSVSPSVRFFMSG
jgi:hypothetical protein